MGELNELGRVGTHGSGTKAEDRNQSKTDSKNYSSNQINEK